MYAAAACMKFKISPSMAPSNILISFFADCAFVIPDINLLASALAKENSPSAFDFLENAERC